MASTTFDGPLQAGLPAITSGGSSIASVMYSRTVSITGATANQTIVLPANVENLDAKLYVLTAGSAAASDDIRVSADGGVNLVIFDAIGSAVGVLRATTAGLGILTTSSAAAGRLNTGTETTVNIQATKSDAASAYQLQLIFSRARDV